MSRDRERGTAALELPLVVGLLLIPLGLLVLHIPVWIERQHAARGAAAEAARAVVVDADGVAAADVEAVVDAVGAGYGLAPGVLRLRLDQDETWVTARVTVTIPAARLPGLGSVVALEWTASHQERRPDLGQRLP